MMGDISIRVKPTENVKQSLSVKKNNGIQTKQARELNRTENEIVQTDILEKSTKMNSETYADQNVNVV